MEGQVTRTEKGWDLWGNVSSSGGAGGTASGIGIGKREAGGEGCGGRRTHSKQRKVQSHELLGTSRVNEKWKLGSLKKMVNLGLGLEYKATETPK